MNMSMTDCDFQEPANWYAIQSKPYREDQAATNIRRMGLTVLLPKIKFDKVQFGHRRSRIKPLFPGYLFVRFSLSPHLHSIRYARGVTRVLCIGDVPVPLGEEVIDLIKSRVGDDGFVRIGKTRFREGEEVVITDGPFQGLVGVFERELDDGERAMILLSAVEYQFRVYVDTLRLSAVTEQQ